MLLTDFSLHFISDIDTSHLNLCVFRFLLKCMGHAHFTATKVCICLCMFESTCVFAEICAYLNFRANVTLSSTSIRPLLKSYVYEVEHQMVMWVFIGQVWLVSVFETE